MSRSNTFDEDGLGILLLRSSYYAETGLKVCRSYSLLACDAVYILVRSGVSFGEL